MRDRNPEFAQAGAPTVFGLSSQTTDYQTEMAHRLALPFPILSDESLASHGDCRCRHSRPPGCGSTDG